MRRYGLCCVVLVAFVCGCVERYDDFSADLTVSADVDGCVPSGEDQVGDGIDQNCDGIDGVDADGDGFASVASGGDDCDDTNLAAFPGAVDFVQGSCADVQMAAATETVDEEGDAGYYTSAALDDAGTLYVAYRSAFKESTDQVRLARRDAADGSWQFFTAYEGVGRYVTLKVAAGNVHIAFHDADNDRLLYVSSPVDALGSGNWTEVVVDDSDGDPGRYASLAVDSAGAVHISYWNKGHDDLCYASNVGGAFAVEVVAGKALVEGEEERVGNFSALTLDSKGKAHISTYNSTFERLDYVTNSKGSWSSTPIDASKPQIGKYTSIAVDSKDGVHISYRDKLLEDLRYASNASGSWVLELVDGESAWVGSDSAIVIDNEDNVHVTYNQGDTDYLRYATRRDNRWSFAVVEESVPCGLQNSLVVDGEGIAHIFSGHNNLGDLLHVEVALECLAFDADGDTNCDGVDGFDGDGDGFASVSSGGRDCDDNDVEIQPQWVTRVVPDAEAEVGEFASLAIDEHNVLHASYYAALTYDLKYARREPSGDWTIETANAEGKVGSFSALAVSSVAADDLAAEPVVHVAYYNETYGELWHSARTPEGWTSEVVHSTPDAGDNVGRFASIAVDEDGFVHITYADTGAAALRYATNLSGQWESMEIPNDGEAGSYSRIAVVKGIAYVAYQAGSSDDLFFLEAALPVLDPSDWGIPLMIDGAEASVGEALSLAVDGQERVHITYRDSGSRYLHYALRANGAWALRTIDSTADVGKYSSLDLDGNDMVHVAYKDQETNTLLYATNVVTENSSWFKEPVAGKDEAVCGGLADECGDHAALRFDTIGRLHALHFDTTNKRLLYSRKACLGY